MNKFLLQVISANRPQNVRPMQKLLGLPCHWYVPPEQANDYRAAGAARVRNAGNLMDSRNLALEHAFSMGRASVQVSDDLQVVKYYDPPEERVEVEFGWAVRYMLAALAASAEHGYPYKLAGTAPNDNKLNYKTEFQYKNFIVGDLIVVLPSTPRFDTIMTLKEDYDFTCQHIWKYGGAMRCAKLMPRFLHRENAGGAVAYRTSEEEQRNIQYLHAKWPKAFVKHRKADEIIMRWRYPEDVK